MRIIIFKIVLAFLFFSGLIAQNKNPYALQKGLGINLGANFYLIGYDSSETGCALKIIKLDSSGNFLADKSFGIGKTKPTLLHPPTVDTTHGYLNVSVQDKNNEKETRFFRIGPSLNLIFKQEKCVVTSLIHSAFFLEEKLYTNNALFTIRPARDTVGSFYLSKLKLADTTGIFNYTFEWQFNFDKNTFHSIHLMEQKDDYLYCYAICTAGGKKGQWILIFEANTGELYKTIKMNMADNELYLYSNHLISGQELTLTLSGMWFKGDLADIEKSVPVFNPKNAKFIPTFIAVFDSSGDVLNFQRSWIPLPNELIKEKENKTYLIRTETLNRHEKGLQIAYRFISEEEKNIFKDLGIYFCDFQLSPTNSFQLLSGAWYGSSRDQKHLPDAKNRMMQFNLKNSSDHSKLLYNKPFIKPTLPAHCNHSEPKCWYFSSSLSRNTGKVSIILHECRGYKWKNIGKLTLQSAESIQLLEGKKNIDFLLYYESKQSNNLRLEILKP